MKPVAVALAVLAGCGRIGFDAPSPGATGDGPNGNGDGSLADDSGTNGDGAVAAGVCGSTTLLDDDFEDGTTAAAWTVLNGTNLTTAETGGFLQLTFASNVPSNQEAGYQQTATMDYTGTCTIAELLQIPNATATGRLEVRLTMSDSTYIFFEVLQGTLHALSNDGVMQIHPAMQTWNLAAHRFLRIRENGGTWYWEVSPDDVSYTMFAMTTQTIPPQSASLKLHVTTSAGVSNGGQVRFGSVRIVR